MSSDLRAKTTRGLLWSSVDRFSNQGMQFVFSIILARILQPKDYGVIAMLLIFTAIAGTFVDSGFSSALIRKPDLKEKDLSTAFYFNIVVGMVCYFLLFLISPYVADFYNEPILSPILKVVGLPVFFNSLTVVQRAQFTRKVDFKTQAKISLLSTVLSGIIGVIMAYKGFGVWALAGQNVSSSIIGSFLLWYYSKWRPQTGFNKDSFQYLFGYGSKLLASGLLDTTYNNIYPMVIGKFFSATQLGFFSRAQTFAALPSSNITNILQRVTFPVLSMIQNDEEGLRRNYRKILRTSAFIIFPMMMGLCALASPLINVVLTSKWNGCVLYLQIICLAMMWYPIHAINLNLLQVKGRSDLFLRLEIIKKIVGVSIMCVTIPLGITSMCIGLVVSSLIALVINTYYTGKLINVGYIRQMRDLFSVFINSIVMGGLCFLSIMFIGNDVLKIIVGFTIGILYYFVSSYLLRFKELGYVLSMLKK
jgi:teichuronic acid exporter